MPTIKELKARLRSHNAKHCVKISGRKSELQARVTRIGGGVAAMKSHFKQLAANASEDQGRRLGKTVSKFENMAPAN
jgi:hypothetical protein